MKDITEKDVFRALTYLAETDQEYAHAKAGVEASKHKAKTVYCMEYMAIKEGTVKDREAYAQVSQAYQDAHHEYTDAIYGYELLATRRKRAELTKEFWQSLNKARLQGSIV